MDLGGEGFIEGLEGLRCVSDFGSVAHRVKWMAAWCSQLFQVKAYFWADFSGHELPKEGYDHSGGVLFVSVSISTSALLAGPGSLSTFPHDSLSFSRGWQYTRRMV